MRTLRIAALIMLATTTGGSSVWAQDIRGFATGGVASDVNNERSPSAGGGIVLNLGQPWLSVGVQGETFWQEGYFTGRGAVFGQGNLIPNGRIRPFVLGGIGFGESAGTMFGGGVELRQPNRRLGLRVSVEDYLSKVDGIDCAGGWEPYCEANAREARDSIRHQVTLRVGILF